MCLFFYLHFTWLYGSWHPQRILKKYPFWKYASWFFSEVSNLTLVRNMLNLSLKYWLMEAKVVFCVYHGPQKWSKYHLETVQTTFSENNDYFRAIFVKINFFHAWKCIISGLKYRSKFWHLRRKPAIKLLNHLFL